MCDWCLTYCTMKLSLFALIRISYWEAHGCNWSTITHTHNSRAAIGSNMHLPAQLGWPPGIPINRKEVQGANLVSFSHQIYFTQVIIFCDNSSASVLSINNKYFCIRYLWSWQVLDVVRWFNLYIVDIWSLTNT